VLVQDAEVQLVRPPVAIAGAAASYRVAHGTVYNGAFASAVRGLTSFKGGSVRSAGGGFVGHVGIRVIC
jgi:hypothetical protein